MTKAFNKGDAVTIIGHWTDGEQDKSGVKFYFRDAFVFSCGKKQMVLTCADTGEELGRHFKPVKAADAATTAFGAANVYMRLDRDHAEQLAQDLAEIRRMEQVQEYRKRATMVQHGESWAAAMADKADYFDGTSAGAVKV